MSLRSVLAMAGLAVIVAACGADAAVGSGVTDIATSVTATPPPTATANANGGTPAPTDPPPTPFPVTADTWLDTLAIGPDGALYASSCQAARVWRLTGDHELQVVVGSGGSGFDTGFVGDGGPATEAQVSCPAGIVFAGNGDLVLADHSNNRIREVDSNGIIQTIAGSGEAGSNRGMYGGDGGPATSGFLQEPSNIAFDRAGNLYISDRDNDRVRKVDAQGTLTTLAGDGTTGFAGDGGAATKARLDGPAGITAAADGTVYVVDDGNLRIRRVDPSGVITTIAGTGRSGNKGDGGPATKASFEDPGGLAVDPAGNLYVTDGTVVRVIDTNGRISRFAGTGVEGASGDGGPATKARLSGVTAIAIDPAGNIYLDDEQAHQVRKVTPDGMISTVFRLP